MSDMFSVFKDEKVLIIMIDDNIYSDDDFEVPSFIQNISSYADFVTSIPTRYDTYRIRNGKVEHTFELYVDSSNKNIYYLVQKNPLVVKHLTPIKNYSVFKRVREGDEIITKRSGYFIEPNYDMDMLMYYVLVEISNDIMRFIKDQFDIYLFFRFRFDDVDEGTGIVLYSLDVYDYVTISFPDFSVTKPSVKTTFIHFDESYELLPLYLSYVLFMNLPNKKIYYDIVLPIQELYGEVNGELVMKIEPSRYLDTVFDNIKLTLFPQEE